MARSTLTLLAAGAMTVLALSGCSVGSAAPSAAPSASPSESSAAQSVEQSCQILQDAVTDSASQLQSAYAQISTDPAAAVQKIKALADALDAGASQVTDPDVKAAAEKGRDSVRGMVDILDAGIATPGSMDVAALQTAATAVQTSFTAIGDLCG